MAMRSWRYSVCSARGELDLQLVEDAPMPTPGAGEVLVKVQAAAVHPGDIKLQSGVLRPFIPPLPFSPGFDVAGEVIEVGPGVTELQKGDQVFGHTELKKGGGFSEYAVLPVKATAQRPPEVPAQEAACLSVGAGTALQGFRDWAKVPIPQPGEEGGEGAPQPTTPPLNVMVANASGGVGHYAVQVAKLAGAHVTATCGERNVAFVKSLGADEVLDYKTPEGTAMISPSGRKYDVFFDCSMGKTWGEVSCVLSDNGVWVQLSPDLTFLGSMLWNNITFGKKKIVSGMLEPRAADAAVLARWAAQGRLKTHVQATYPFDKLPEAWKACKEGHVTGRVVLVFDGEAKG